MKQKEPKGYKELSKLLTMKEVTEILNCSRKKIYGFIDRGELRAYKIGRDLRFKESDLKKFIESREVKQ